MTRIDFQELFIRALNLAAENAEKKIESPIPRSFVIELHAPGLVGSIVNIDEALDYLYLGDDCFYRIIDVAIKALFPETSMAFVRVSGNSPGAFSKTWNPSGLGPFKQIVAERIEGKAVRN